MEGVAEGGRGGEEEDDNVSEARASPVPSDTPRQSAAEEEREGQEGGEGVEGRGGGERRGERAQTVEEEYTVKIVPAPVWRTSALLIILLLVILAGVVVCAVQPILIPLW